MRDGLGWGMALAAYLSGFTLLALLVVGAVMI